MEKLKEMFTPNRVFALAGLVTAIATALITFQASLVPGSPGAEAVAKAIVLLGCLGTVLGIVYKFLDGSQKWDKLEREEKLVRLRRALSTLTEEQIPPPPTPPVSDVERHKGFGQPPAAG